MGIQKEILLEGTYLYYDKNVNFSQENFKLLRLPEPQHYLVEAEILSRVETGEFLKVIVHYEMNNNFVPLDVRIEKSIGNKFVQESFKVDISAQELHYVFKNAEGSQEFKRPHGSKHHLTSPAFSTSAMFTLTKRFDATGRTGINLVNSTNNWTYQNPPEDRLIFAEYKSRELIDYKLNNTPLSASHLCLYEHDSSHANHEKPVEYFLSKHYGLPYQMVHGDFHIDVKHLKKIN